MLPTCLKLIGSFKYNVPENIFSFFLSFIIYNIEKFYNIKNNYFRS